ncbi:MAG: YaeQ family protein [Planctomycetes bacterium]|nr:YaeQ family protein [Planctomycetota bacterium]
MRQNFDVSINDYNRELFTEHKTVIEQREGESPTHLMLKILALALYFEPKILIEPSDVDPTFKPDLLVRAIDGFPKLWIECGQVKTAKLDKLTNRYRDAKFVVVKRLEREIRDLCGRCEKEVRNPWILEYVGFDNDFVESVARNIHGRNDLTAILSGDDLTVVINGFEYNSKVHRLDHGEKPYRGR